MNLKHKFQLLTIGALVVGTSTCFLISCSDNPGKKLLVDWRTEDLDCNVSNPISSTREWIWINKPNVEGGTWKVANNSQLPPGIVLNSYTGQLNGTPTEAGVYFTKFTYSINGYKTSTSKGMKFTVSQDGHSAPVDWVGDMNFDHDVNIALANGTKVGNEKITGGAWEVRQGFSIPTGLIFDGNKGIIYGNPTVAGVSQISFVYMKSGYQDNVSNIFDIFVYYVHTLAIDNMTNGNYTCNDMVVKWRKLEDTQVTNWNDFLTFLYDQGYRYNTARYAANGTIMKNGGAYDTLVALYTGGSKPSLDTILCPSNSYTHDPIGGWNPEIKTDAVV